jgi:hypothetical protein
VYRIKKLKSGEGSTKGSRVLIIIIIIMIIILCDAASGHIIEPPILGQHMNNKLERIWEVSDRGQIEVLSQNLPGRDYENHDKPHSPVIRCPCQNSSPNTSFSA